MIHNIITEIESEYHIQFTKDSSKLLSFYLELMMERNQRGFYINKHIPSFGDEYHLHRISYVIFANIVLLNPMKKKLTHWVIS